MIVYNEKLASAYNEYHKQSKVQFDMQLSKLFQLTNTVDGNILDVGCGAGRLLTPMLKIVNSKNIIYGVEKSANMRNQITHKHKQLVTLGDASNLDFLIKIIKKHNIKKLYFSFSLHQIVPQKCKQIEYLNTLLKHVTSISIITTLPQNFNENLITKYCEKAYKYDCERFLTVNEYFSNFNVTFFNSEKFYTEYNKQMLIDKFKNKFISTLQLITQDELDKIIDCIDRDYDETVIYPDFYTYIQIK